MLNQRFSVSATVTGSCAAGDEYPYSLRADVIDRNSGKIISANRTSIPAYNLSNFSITLTDSVTAPAEATAAWNIEIAVIVFVTTTIGPQDSVGVLVRDYSTVGYAAIQVGLTQTVPEFTAQNSAVELAFAFVLVAALTAIKSRQDRNI